MPNGITSELTILSGLFVRHTSISDSDGFGVLRIYQARFFFFSAQLPQMSLIAIPGLYLTSL